MLMMRAPAARQHASNQESLGRTAAPSGRWIGEMVFAHDALLSVQMSWGRSERLKGIPDDADDARPCCSLKSAVQSPTRTAPPAVSS